MAFIAFRRPGCYRPASPRISPLFHALARRAAEPRRLVRAALLSLVALYAGAAPAATAADVSATTPEGSVGVLIPLSGGGAPPLAYALASPPAHGAVLISGATAAYTPEPNFSGTDSFLYVVTDAADVASSAATVAVTVETVAPQAVTPPAVRIEKKALVDANGNPFEVKGLIVRPVISPFFLDELAFQHFGDSELAAAHAWGANTIRLLTSQPALDPQDPGYDAQYVLSVGNAAQQVLDHGFVLIIGVNDETGSGETMRHCLPTDATKRAWTTLLGLSFSAPQYSGRVMLEPFNEPVAGGDPGKPPAAFWWNIWQNGGSVDAYGVGPSVTCIGERKVGMNELIGEIRNAGAKNIIIADGLSWAHFLNPLFPLNDPLGQLAYGAHPFLERWTGFHLAGKPVSIDQVLDAAFGAMQSQGPVIATAVGGGAESAGTAATSHCFRNAPQVMPVLLRYLRQKHMGAVGWAFDLPPNTLTVDWNYTPTSYAGFRCPAGNSPGQGGPGELLRQWFLSSR